MNSQFPDELLERVHRSAVVAVLVIDQVRHAVPVAQALLRGGVDVMELTLRTPAALGALEAIRADVPEMVAGIGTILRVEQVRDVVNAGASFGVAPGTNPRVIQAAREAGLPFAPGVVTPSDMEVAIELGCRELKFFPAEASGGLEYLRSAAAPFRHLGARFIPLGGISGSNLGQYLADPLIWAVGGSWLAPQECIQREDWKEIERRARDARAVVERVRGEG